MYSKDAGKDQMLMTMERALTSGQKAGFFFLGFLGGIVGILAASLMNINAPYLVSLYHCGITYMSILV